MESENKNEFEELPSFGYELGDINIENTSDINKNINSGEDYKELDFTTDNNEELFDLENTTGRIEGEEEETFDAYFNLGENEEGTIPSIPSGEKNSTVQTRNEKNDDISKAEIEKVEISEDELLDFGIEEGNEIFLDDDLEENRDDNIFSEQEETGNNDQDINSSVVPIKNTYSRKKRDNRALFSEEEKEDGSLENFNNEELNYLETNLNDKEDDGEEETNYEINLGLSDDDQIPLEKTNHNYNNVLKKKVSLSQNDMLGVFTDEDLNSIQEKNNVENETDNQNQTELQYEANNQHIDLSPDEMLDEIKILDAGEIEKRKRRPYDDITKPQATFQPGSTPMKNNRQYLVINQVGSISTMEHEEFSTITVEYNDQSHYRGYNLKDDYNYSMACLDKCGALFSTESVEVEPGKFNLSVLTYKPQETWDFENEWTITFPQAIALSSEGIIAATSKDLLRFFSLRGVQTYVFNLSSVVSMVAQNEFALIVYHMGPGYKGSQNLGYILYNLHNDEIVQRDHLPISRESILQWIGFSEEGMPALFDSNGVLSVLLHHRVVNQGRWAPVLDTSLNRKEEEKDYVYWPVWLAENKSICFICKNGEQYPRIPRPSYDEISWQIPLLEMDKQFRQYEEKVMRLTMITRFEFDEAKAKNTLEQEREKIRQKNTEIDKTLLELINLSCKEDKLQRALDLVKLLSTAKSLDLAIKIATFHKKSILADKINQLKEIEYYYYYFKLLKFIEFTEFIESFISFTRIEQSTFDSTSYQDFTSTPDISNNNGSNQMITDGSSTENIRTVSKRRAQEMDEEDDDLYFEEAFKSKKSSTAMSKKNPFLIKPTGPIINPFAVSNEPNTIDGPEKKKPKIIKNNNNKSDVQKKQTKLGGPFGTLIKQGEPVIPLPENVDDVVIDEFGEKDIGEYNLFDDDQTETQNIMDFDFEQSTPVDNENDQTQLDYEYDQLPVQSKVVKIFVKSFGLVSSS
ncbi:8949_t:CDS:10 [Diversispora eburnea]|uniref:8949_t:CDS:1 n=1 Tax=Diversispora eburnea TaxID=1213867 RepID=A0A9N9A7M6_9GLOM|nr:8949_t:CDS:10 [Diversispora eburnea]